MSLMSRTLFSYAVVGLVVTGGTWYLTRLARGPTSASRFTLCRVRLVTVCLQSSGPRTTLPLGTTSSRTRAPSSSRSTSTSTRGEYYVQSPPLRHCSPALTSQLGAQEAVKKQIYGISFWCSQVQALAALYVLYLLKFSIQ